MVAEDIVDCLNTKHPYRNWGFDTIRWISSVVPLQFRFDNLNNLHNAFRNLGTCESKTITKADDMDQLLDCYMLRYKENAAGISGPGIDGSINYLFKEKMAEVTTKLKSNPEFTKTHEIIKSLETNGLYDDIEIVIAFDTFIKK